MVHVPALAVLGIAFGLTVAGAMATPVSSRPDPAASSPYRVAQAQTDADADDAASEPDEPEDAEDTEDGDATGTEAETSAEGEDTGAGDAASGADEATAPAGDTDELTILRSPDRLPEPVRRTWQALIDAARSGNIESLRLLIDVQPSPPVFSFGEITDPIDYLKSLSGDAAGREVLAILLEILETGYMHVDRGTPEEMYLWPYFARYPLARLTPREIVEMFTILTAGDYQDMLSYGAYIFFRVGIGPDGTWHFFVAGD